MPRDFIANESMGEKIKTPKSTEEIRRGIEIELEKIGWPGNPPAEIVEHFLVLEQLTGFNDDSRMILEGVTNIVEYDSSFRLDAIQRKRLYLATFLHDIGKAGPFEYPDCRLAVTRLFAIENIKNQNQTVEQTLQDPEYFSGDESAITDMLFGLAKVNILHNTTMREFWNQHAIWSNNFLNNSSHILPKEVIIIASSHHINAGINPCKIKSENNILEIENEIKFSIFLLMAIDKYQASFGRQQEGDPEMTHEKAMEELEKALRPYDGDWLMQMIIKNIEQL